MEKEIASISLKISLRHTAVCTKLRKEQIKQGINYRLGGENRISECFGPFRVLGLNESKDTLYIQVKKVGEARTFNFEQVKSYFRDESFA